VSAATSTPVRGYPLGAAMRASAPSRQLSARPERGRVPRRLEGPAEPASARADTPAVIRNLKGVVRRPDAPIGATRPHHRALPPFSQVRASKGDPAKA
jgi:hypothetical protein